MKLKNNKFRGIIAIKQNENICFQHINGFSDLKNEIPNAIDTRFASASAGKVFVAVVVLQLMEEGKLKFSDTLGDLLNTMDFKKIDKGVTVEQLLTHTSGVPDYFDESVMDEYEELWIDFPNYKIRKNEDLLPLFIEKDMIYPKGTKFQYNNTGYVLLAMIIEKITKLPFDKAIQERVFNFCKMTHSGYYELDRLPSKCASNYIYLEEIQDYKTNIFSVDAKGTGAGGAFISAPDIFKFWEKLTAYELLSKEMTTKMMTSKRCENEKTEYGYGLWIYEDHNENEIPSFQGSDPGVSFFTEYNPTKNIISVLVSNYGDDVWEEMSNIRELLY